MVLGVFGGVFVFVGVLVVHVLFVSFAVALIGVFAGGVFVDVVVVGDFGNFVIFVRCSI